MSNAQTLQQQRQTLDASVARQRIGLLLDEGSFAETGAFAGSNGVRAEVVTGYGTVCGMPVCVFAQDPSQGGGAMSTAQAAKISAVYDLALKTGSPVIGLFDSRGARVDQGVRVLNAVSELLLKSNNLSGLVPQIAVVVGVCGASSAILAAESDVVVMTRGAELFLNPPFNSSSECGDAESAANAGAVHAVAENEDEAFGVVRQLLTLLPDNNLTPTPAAEPAESAQGCPYCELVDAESDVELCPEFGKGARTSLARVSGVACGVVSFDAGESGLIDSDTALKVSRFVRLCDAFSLPVITLADVAGFDDGGVAGVRAAAALAHAYAEATCAKVSVVTRRAYGSAFIALCGKSAGSDASFALEGSVISVLPPVTAVSVLFNDRISAGQNREELVSEYESGRGSAFSAAQSGAVDELILRSELKSKVSAALAMLASKRVETAPKKHSNMPL